MHELTFNQRRNFSSRKKGIFKKAFEVTQLFNAQVLVLIECEATHYAFCTDGTVWPPNYGDIKSTLRELKAPCDYQTVRQIRQTNTSATQLQTSSGALVTNVSEFQHDPSLLPVQYFLTSNHQPDQLDFTCPIPTIPESTQVSLIPTPPEVTPEKRNTRLSLTVRPRSTSNSRDRVVKRRNNNGRPIRGSKL